MITVQQFIRQSYRLINASNPTVPLHGDDEQLSITILNQLLNSYAATGLMLTIAQTYTFNLAVGQSIVVCGPPTYLPTPDVPIGRLANYDSAWLTLDGVQYPLIEQNRDAFLAAWLYQPLSGLPRFCIVYPQNDVVNIQIYPSPSQIFSFSIRGKFQLNDVLPSDTLDSLPAYYVRYLQFALARDVAMYKGRSDAWTDKLELLYREAKDIMEASSEVNLSIVGERESLLNGSWRVMAGI